MALPNMTFIRSNLISLGNTPESAIALALTSANCTRTHTLSASAVCTHFALALFWECNLHSWVHFALTLFWECNLHSWGQFALALFWECNLHSQKSAICTLSRMWFSSWPQMAIVYSLVFCLSTGVLNVWNGVFFKGIVPLSAFFKLKIEC